MNSDTPAWSVPKERVSRHDAEQALIAAVIELVDTTPIADITVHQLAHVAGVNFGYVNRYFGSRLNLFAAATDALADQGLAQLHQATGSNEVIVRPTTKDFSRPDRHNVRQTIMPIGVKRLKLVQFLISSGVPADRFVDKSREVMEAGIAITIQAGLDPQLARARIIHGMSMMWARATLVPVFGFTDDDLDAAYTTVFADLNADNNNS